MLAKFNRLHTSSDIRTVRTTGKRYFGQLMTIFILQNQGQTQAQFGFVVSKQISKKAVERNRTKRLLREAVSQMLPTIDYTTSALILAKMNLSEVPLPKIREELTALLRSAGITKE